MPETTSESLLRSALYKLHRAANDVLTGISIHNNSAPDSPARMKDIDGPVIRILNDASHEARMLLSDLETPNAVRSRD